MRVLIGGREQLGEVLRLVDARLVVALVLRAEERVLLEDHVRVIVTRDDLEVVEDPHRINWVTNVSVVFKLFRLD